MIYDIKYGWRKRFSLTSEKLFWVIVTVGAIFVVLWTMGWFASVKTLVAFLAPISVVVVAAFFRAARKVRCSHCGKIFRRGFARWHVSSEGLGGYRCPHCDSSFNQ